MKAKHPVNSGAYARCAVTLAMAALLALSACREDEDATIPAAPHAATEAPADARDWLDVGDARSPLAFMAESTGLPESELSPGLDALAAHYRESPRMIANRVVQLWEQPPGAVPPVPQLMAELLPKGAGQHSLGPVIQQYRVLREQGADHATAMTAAVEGETQ